MKVREHRGSIQESMETCVEIHPTMDALVKVITESLSDMWVTKKVKVKVEPYMYDTRTGWDTHIVTVKGWGIFGFTDGPLDG